MVAFAPDPRLAPNQDTGAAYAWTDPSASPDRRMVSVAQQTSSTVGVGSKGEPWNSIFLGDKIPEKDSTVANFFVCELNQI